MIMNKFLNGDESKGKKNENEKNWLSLLEIVVVGRKTKEEKSGREKEEEKKSNGHGL